MTDEFFDQQAWLTRIGYIGSRQPTLDTLHALIAAHASAIPFESIDALLDRPPMLDIGHLQAKMIRGGRGGYCFEQNMLFRQGLRSFGYDVTSLQARVVRGLAIDAPRPMHHMVLQVNLREGHYLADVGFGHLTPTAALKLEPDIEQATRHEPMRFITFGEELVLQSWTGERWDHIYRVVHLPRFDSEYEVSNWFTATYPESPFRNNLIAALPGENGTRLTLFNSRFKLRQASGKAELHMLEGEDDYRVVLKERFQLALTSEDFRLALSNMRERATGGSPHPFFA